jgi:acetyl esterase/lipase
MAESAGRFGIDPKRIAVGGDSAGGNLAAATALLARDGGSAQPCFQMLIYPVIDRRMQTESMKRFSDTPMWNSVLNAKMWKWYLEGAGSANIEYASPIEADSLVGLPEAYVETAEFDCLHDEGAAYAAALNSAGCLTRLNETSGTMHGFDIVSGSTIVRDSVYARVESLRQAFGIRRE